MVMGKKGAGKTTYLTKQAINAVRKGQIVYSTVDIPFTVKITDEDLKNFGRYKFKENSLILIDEVGMIWDNRDFKNFNKKTRDYFKLQRHYKNKIILFSQTFDVDKKLRDLTDKMYLLTNLGAISILRPIHKKMTVATDSDGNGTLTDTYEFGLPFEWQFLFLPRYFKFFNSYIQDDLLDFQGKEREKEELRRFISTNYWIRYIIRQFIYHSVKKVKFFSRFFFRKIKKIIKR